MYRSSKHLCPLHRDQLGVLGIFWAKGLDSILLLTGWQPLDFPFSTCPFCPLRPQGPPMPVARVVLTVKEAGEVFFSLVWALDWWNQK